MEFRLVSQKKKRTHTQKGYKKGQKSTQIDHTLESLNEAALAELFLLYIYIHTHRVISTLSCIDLGVRFTK